MPELTELTVMQNPLYEQPDLLEQLRFQTFGEFPPWTTTRVYHHDQGREMFDRREMSIMRSPSERLNDSCLNGIATVLRHQFCQSTSLTWQASQRCALFNTHHLPMMRYHVPDSELWRRTKRTQYWARDIWILPIHRRGSEHWVLCTVSLATRELFLFDSLAACSPWKCEVKVSALAFKNQMILLACPRKLCCW